MSSATLATRIRKRGAQVSLNNVSGYSLRRSRATHLYARTGDLPQVQHFLRHEKKTTTLDYLLDHESLGMPISATLTDDITEFGERDYSNRNAFDESPESLEDLADIASFFFPRNKSSKVPPPASEPTTIQEAAALLTQLARDPEAAPRRTRLQVFTEAEIITLLNQASSSGREQSFLSLSLGYLGVAYANEMNSISPEERTGSERDLFVRIRPTTLRRLSWPWVPKPILADLARLLDSYDPNGTIPFPDKFHRRNLRKLCVSAGMEHNTDFRVLRRSWMVHAANNGIDTPTICRRLNIKDPDAVEESVRIHGGPGGGASRGIASALEGGK